MKKINSINYSHYIIGLGFCLLIPLPLILTFINYIIRIRVINVVKYIMPIIGAVILLIFFIYLCIESRQDKRICEYYEKHRNIKLKLKDGRYECYKCGNINVSKDDSICSICGVKFEKYPNLNSQEILEIKTKRRKK